MTRLRNTRPSISDFKVISLIGQGHFGQVGHLYFSFIIIINACLLKTILEINLLLYKSRPNSTQYFFIKVQVVKEVQTNNVYALKTLKKSEMLSQENVRKSLTMLCQKIGRKHFIGT